MTATLLHIIWTVVALVIFVGIVIWAWSGKRKSDFEALAHLPLEDERPQPPEPPQPPDSRSCA
ncbi:MAG: cbb3-type cytochrome oxidase subunit 3 [Gammaproteobacteria bacterium]